MVVKPNKWQSPPSLAKTWYLEVDPIPAVRSGIDKLMERFGYVNVYFRFGSRNVIRLNWSCILNGFDRVRPILSIYHRGKSATAESVSEKTLADTI